MRLRFQIRIGEIRDVRSRNPNQRKANARKLMDRVAELGIFGRVNVSTRWKASRIEIRIGEARI